MEVANVVIVILFIVICFADLDQSASAPATPAPHSVVAPAPHSAVSASSTSATIPVTVKIEPGTSENITFILLFVITLSLFRINSERKACSIQCRTVLPACERSNSGSGG
jgi:ABC-type transport system involved in cytochrome c biogenesis permease subunit